MAEEVSQWTRGFAGKVRSDKTGGRFFRACTVGAIGDSCSARTSRELVDKSLTRNRLLNVSYCPDKKYSHDAGTAHEILHDIRASFSAAMRESERGDYQPLLASELTMA